MLQSMGSQRVRHKQVTEQPSSSSLLKKQCSPKNIIKCTRGKKECKSCNPINNANSWHTLFYIFFSFWPRYATCGLPDQGSNQCSFQWKHRFLITGPSGKSPPLAFFFKMYVYMPLAVHLQPCYWSSTIENNLTFHLKGKIKSCLLEWKFHIVKFFSKGCRKPHLFSSGQGKDKVREG